jgi:undecaprenyl diphosphate synthase
MEEIFMEKGLLEDNLPKHIAIIMDGNGRWAKNHGLPRTEGHRKGIDSLRHVIETCIKHQIPMLTVFGFSTENWQRPSGEVSFLMETFEEVLNTHFDELNQNGVRLRILGDKSRLKPDLIKQIEECEEQSRNNERLTLNVAWNYGGRNEIVEAAKKFAHKVITGEIQIDSLNEDSFRQFLYIKDMPDADLLIRTGGDFRVSNFLLWQLAYAEIYITPVCWPEFNESELNKALLEYQSRERRFGKV